MENWGKLLGYFVGITLLTTGVILVPSIGGGSWLPDLISEEGKGIDYLFWGFVVLSILILAGVMAIVVYAVAHWRVRPGDLRDGAPIHGHVGLEWGWTIAFAVIVLVISTISTWVLYEQEVAPARGTGMVVQPRAFQFGWDFTYPDQGVRQAANLVLEVDKTTRFDVLACSGRETEGHCRKRYGAPQQDEQGGDEGKVTRRDDDQGDVLHAFWVPEARLKIDAVPNIPTWTQWTPSKVTGPDDVFQVVCAELCGSGHNAMRAEACVVSSDVFEWWTDNSDVLCPTLRLFSCEGADTSDLDELRGKADELLSDDPEADCEDMEEAA